METPKGHVSKLYKNRFEGELEEKNELWKVLCECFFQKFVGPEDTVLDIGAGYCEFINNIRCREKIALDLNEDVRAFAGDGVKTLVAPSTGLTGLSDNSVDKTFMSNLLEHLDTKDDVLKTLSEVFRVLRPGGSAMILQPNIKYLYREYWDFFDHNVPLSDSSLCEALRLTGFELELVIDRFLPYTTKSWLPKAALLVKAYLLMPLAWKVLGKQMFIVATKVAAKKG